MLMTQRFTAEIALNYQEHDCSCECFEGDKFEDIWKLLEMFLNYTWIVFIRL